MIDGMLFPVQIIVTRELEKNTHIWLKSLTRDIAQTEAEDLLGHCDGLRMDDVKYRQAKCVVNLVSDINEDVFKRITIGGGKMSDELKYMILPELKEKDAELANKDAEIEQLRRELVAIRA